MQPRMVVQTVDRVGTWPLSCAAVASVRGSVFRLRSAPVSSDCRTTRRLRAYIVSGEDCIVSLVVLVGFAGWVGWVARYIWSKKARTGGPRTHIAVLRALRGV